MLKCLSVGLVLGSLVVSGSALASPRITPAFVRSLDRDGTLSAGWIRALPGLATSCNLRLDNRELTDRLVALSREAGNASYTADLYAALYRIEQHHGRDAFGSAWTARFDGRPTEACRAAEALWGDSGHQFRGILKRDATSDGSPGSGNMPNNCR